MTENNDLRVVEDVMMRNSNEEPEECNPELGASFLQAAEDGNRGRVEEMLQGNPNLIHFQDEDGYTALHRAAYSDEGEIVKFLLSKGSSVSARTNDGWTPLHSASRWNAWTSVRILLAAGADPNAMSQGGQTPLHLAADSGKGETVTLLLLHPTIDPWILNSAGDSAEEIASRQGSFAYLFELSKKSVNTF